MTSRLARAFGVGVSGLPSFFRFAGQDAPEFIERGLADGSDLFLGQVSNRGDQGSVVRHE